MINIVKTSEMMNYRVMLDMAYRTWYVACQITSVTITFPRPLCWPGSRVQLGGSWKIWLSLFWRGCILPRVGRTNVQRSQIRLNNSKPCLIGRMFPDRRRFMSRWCVVMVFVDITRKWYNCPVCLDLFEMFLNFDTVMWKLRWTAVILKIWNRRSCW